MGNIKKSGFREGLGPDAYMGHSDCPVAQAEIAGRVGYGSRRTKLPSGSKKAHSSIGNPDDYLERDARTPLPSEKGLGHLVD